MQALIQKKLGREIPYILCHNQQLHLAVVHAIQAETCARTFFDLSSALHSLFHRQYVIHNYDVPCLKRLLEIRWTSHYDVTKCLVDNKEDILAILSEVSHSSTAPMDIRTEASGLMVQIRTHNFFDIGHFLVKILGVLKPANAMLQCNTVNLCTASEVISACLQALKDMRTDPSWDQFEMTADIPGQKRKRTVNKHLSDSVVLTSVGHTDLDSSNDPSTPLKRSLLHILDRAIAEMESRFSVKNLELIKAVNSLLPQSASFLDLGMLSPLQLLAGSEREGLRNEMCIAKPMLLRQFPTKSDLSAMCKHMQGYKEAFPELHRLYVTALVIGVSSASCERSFSTLARILTPFRRTMLHKRKENLVILAHEKTITNNLDMEKFVDLFAMRSRRLVL